jgi:hypothetical protein
MFLEHDAMSYADKIGPVPLLMIVEDQATKGASRQVMRSSDPSITQPRTMTARSEGHVDMLTVHLPPGVSLRPSRPKPGP